MELFHIIDGGTAILFSRGVYRQAKVFRRGEHIFAQHGGGFIRLLQKGGTSVPSVAWKDLEGDGIGFTGVSTSPFWVG